MVQRCVMYQSSSIPSSLFVAVKLAGDVNGVPASMAAHINGYRGHSPCLHASQEARDAAHSHKNRMPAPMKSVGHSVGQKCVLGSIESLSDDEDASSGPEMKKLCQAPLVVFQGIDLPFTAEQQLAIKEQATRAIISTGSAFSLFEDIEMVKLMTMLRSVAPRVLPKGKAVGTTWLDKCAGRVEEVLLDTFENRQIGLSYVNCSLSALGT
jgi:hypothetical protein